MSSRTAQKKTRTAGRKTKRSLVRRLGESAFGVLLLARAGLMALIALVLVVAGAWTSWDTASVAMTGDERGTVTVASCDDDTCTGTFLGEGETEAGAGAGAGPQKVTVSEFVSGGRGETLEVAVEPGTEHVVRTGPAGILYAWVPLGGSLLLASLVIAGGLRMRRTAAVTGLCGALLMGGAWALLTF
ncbi:hypothetical protein FM076_13575 [Streptomyces albus subsp. chlorinus]|uniref:hypothetical protein n=1 Tax=Streptomyces albus TaxID=1888 RepID=UPI00156D52D1|nr:hypothetical protein [Streptomyces albus]NSC22164.1 hypothetical protein [Streptomyces albus subsp. chlorinus]